LREQSYLIKCFENKINSREVPLDYKYIPFPGNTYL